ncbi:hypothetical protein BDK51DRAFT_43293 [Blyttiomyces helicus]|uniref:Uncharacterized protein n=1 Tax=Blyttiomyces helicus TaxID=388810 RepID=A0A4P9W8S4_9FUNG|nr:hypothetical protein BDK51DRAFT_43293 [Blyttiomyces helicus]|eukprot:RKO87488.1 hypothetical protein BDK51DRAFT_43293 [Blyttiomyces helicus]
MRSADRWTITFVVTLEICRFRWPARPLATAPCLMRVEHSPLSTFALRPDTSLLELPDNQVAGSQCFDLRAASLACRAWEPAASARIWTHVVLHSDRALRTFVVCLRVSRAKHAAIVRTREFRFNRWHLHARSDFAFLVPELRGLRQFVAGDRLVSKALKLSGPYISIVALFLTSCPGLVALDVPAPCGYMENFREDEGEDLVLASKYGFKLKAAISAIGKLKHLRLVGPDFPSRRFLRLLLRSVTSRLVELSLTNIQWPSSFEGPQGMDATSLRNLEVLEVINTRCNFLTASLIELHPPLRRLVLYSYCFSALCEKLPLLPSPPSITHLEPVSSLAIPDAALVLLDQHPPLRFLGIHYHALSPRKSLPPGTFTSKDLQRFLRIRGSNLKVLDLCYTVPVDDALLACIVQYCPLLEGLGIQRHWAYIRKQHLLPLKKVAFIEDLKRACPNLRYVDVGVHTLPTPTREESRGAPRSRWTIRSGGTIYELQWEHLTDHLILVEGARAAAVDYHGLFKYFAENAVGAGLDDLERDDVFDVFALITDEHADAVDDNSGGVGNIRMGGWGEGKSDSAWEVETPNTALDAPVDSGYQSAKAWRQDKPVGKYWQLDQCAADKHMHDVKGRLSIGDVLLLSVPRSSVGETDGLAIGGLHEAAIAASHNPPSP